MVDQSVESYVRDVCLRARAAANRLACADPKQKEEALLRMAGTIREQAESIREANAQDVAGAREKGLSEAMVDRLTLTGKRLDQVAAGLEEIAISRDPIGEVVARWRRPGGLEVGQVRIPLGVVGIIYESRPNVTADAAGLCFKAGNATILRGGSEAIHSNLALARAIREALSAVGMDSDAVQVMETPDRAAVGALLRQNELVDVIIPRGGKSLIRRVVEESTIPVIKHYEGICHVYVHADADLEMALRIALNAKVQRPGTCNAAETILIDRVVADRFLPQLIEAFQAEGVRLHGCPLSRRMAEGIAEATAENYRTEYLALECNLRVVEDLEEAIRHIQIYGSRHTDAIVTRSLSAARRFTEAVDSSSVMVNASTRLADGSVYGLGAEIGISTDKLHAYGPMGVLELTSRKFVVFGDGTLRE
jgi:glutamate-5-semialdehyde dehydrogenase